MISENSLFLMVLNMFDYKIRSTGVKLIKFYLKWLIMLAFGELHKLSERNVYTEILFLARSCKFLAS